MSLAARRKHWENPVLQEHRYYRGIFLWLRGDDLDRVNELIGTEDSASSWLENQQGFIDALTVLIETEDENSIATLGKFFGDHRGSLAVAREKLAACQRRATPAVAHLDKLIQEGVIPVEKPWDEFANLYVLYFGLYHHELGTERFLNSWRTVRSSTRYREFIVAQDALHGGSLEARLNELEDQLEAISLLDG